MPVRKKVVEKEEVSDVYEDVIKQDDRVEQFTIAKIDQQISRYEANIVSVQAEIDKLLARKVAALALN